MDRRRALTLLALATATSAVARPIVVHPSEPANLFRHGVASGDPHTDSVILWTRAAPPDGGRRPIALQWEVARDSGFTKIVARGAGEAGPERDFTFKALAEGLDPGTDYWYRFRAGAAASPTGRTRTLPTAALDRLVLAFVCCQHYEAGLFNVHQAVAELDELDAVVHLGDYIYEDAAMATGFVRDIATQLGRVVEPRHATITLADYRTRHAIYKTDPDLQAAHARTPWICVWDDHEVADDSWQGGAKAHHAARDGAWGAREAAALRAYYEWMPIREPAHGQSQLAINRTFDFGDLATLVMVETRLMARARQITYDKAPMIEGPHGPEPDVEGLRRELADPSRQLMGPAQETWLADTLERSVTQGRAWQVLSSQVVMAKVTAPDLKALVGPGLTDMLISVLPQEKRAQAARMAQLLGKGLPYNTDSWDGYPAARERLYGAFRRAGARPVVVSGDSHAFWINELVDDGSQRVGVELGVGSITSPGAGDVVPVLDIGGLFEEANADVRFNDQSAKGFVRLTLTRQTMLGELLAVSSVREKPFSLRTLKQARVERAPDGAMGALQVV